MKARSGAEDRAERAPARQRATAAAFRVGLSRRW
jgi:hypothetical protein